MFRHVQLVISIAIAAFSARAYDVSLPNLLTPSVVGEPSVEVVFQHRFTRGIGEPSYSLLGGATVNVGVTGNIWNGIGISADFYTLGDELDFGASYSGEVPGNVFTFRADAHVFGFKEERTRSRVASSWFAGAISLHALPERIWLTGNLIYDSYNLLVVPSAGLLLRIVPALELTGEYSFAHDSLLMRRNAFSAGIKFNTWRHQFRLLFSNAGGNGGRLFIVGARDNRVRIGFSIERLFDF